MAIERITGITPKDFGFDELVAGEAWIHIERMNRNHIWMVVTSKDKTVTLNLYAKRNTLYVNAESRDGTVKPNSGM